MLDLQCQDLIYLNAYIPRLQTSAQVVAFLLAHLGYPLPSPALICDLSGVANLDPVFATVFSIVANHPASRWPTTSFLLCGAQPQVAQTLNQVHTVCQPRRGPRGGHGPAGPSAP